MNLGYYFYAMLGCILGIAMAIAIFTEILLDPRATGSMIGFFQEIIQALRYKLYTNKGLASSVWCVTKEYGTKQCHFENLFYLPQYESHLVFLLNENSMISGIESSEILKHISLSSVSNHSGFNLKLLMVRRNEYILQQNVVLVEKETFFLKRFKPDNIMHVIHDDLLPLFSTYQDLCVGNINFCKKKYQLVFLDENPKGPYFDWYIQFSNHKPFFLSKAKVGLCFKSCMVGLSKRSVWFQYGFKTVQGPLHNSYLDGEQLREFTKFIKSQFRKKEYSLSITNELGSSTTAVLLSRKINRKILNENEVVNNLKHNFKRAYNKSLEVIILDLSTNDSKSIISTISNTDFLVGMHGSAMILAMFLPPGSTIIELFPFGIQPEVVSPLKALCSLTKVNLNYFHWVNNNEGKSLTHPEYPELLGGISNLQSTDQEKIISVKLVPPVACCHNPVYLFRMFQDTYVDDSFFYLVSSILSKKNKCSEIIDDVSLEDFNVYYYPPPVFKINCDCTDTYLKIMWSFPFNSTLRKVKFSLATDTGFSTTTEDDFYSLKTEYCSRIKNVCPEDNHYRPISVWIKTIENDKESVDSYHLCKI